MIEEFELRGWKNQNEVEDPDLKFDFSFRLGNFNTNAMNQKMLCNDQIISAFKGMSLTSKFGMMRLLKRAHKLQILDATLFFPKAFDMSQK